MAVPVSQDLDGFNFLEGAMYSPSTGLAVRANEEYKAWIMGDTIKRQSLRKKYYMACGLSEFDAFKEAGKEGFFGKGFHWSACFITYCGKMTNNGYHFTGSGHTTQAKKAYRNRQKLKDGTLEKGQHHWILIFKDEEGGKNLRQGDVVFWFRNGGSKIKNLEDAKNWFATKSNTKARRDAHADICVSPSESIGGNKGNNDVKKVTTGWYAAVIKRFYIK